MHEPINAMNWESPWALSAKITDEEQAHKDTCPETPAWMELGLHAVPSPPPADWELPEREDASGLLSQQRQTKQILSPKRKREAAMANHSVDWGGVGTPLGCTCFKMAVLMVMVLRTRDCMG